MEEATQVVQETFTRTCCVSRMEEGSPVLETFTQVVNDGPSQPLMRKLMSMMLSREEDPEMGGFFLVDDNTSSRQGPAPVLGYDENIGQSSRQQQQGPAPVLGYNEDIPQNPAPSVVCPGCPVEDMEAVIQSGFRFPEAEGYCESSPRVEGCCDPLRVGEGCCYSPRAENYFGQCSSIDVPPEKIPIDFLHAVNNALDTKVIPTPKTHHHGPRRRGGRRAGVLKSREEPCSSSSSPFGASYGQEMVLRRLDRLEEICLRTESYVHLVLGTLDRRLQLLEGDLIRPASRDSSCSPRFPGGFTSRDSSCSPRFPGAFTSEAGTLVTPEMLMLQSPHRDRSLLSVGVLGEPGDPEIYLSPIDSLPSPALILASSLTAVAASAAASGAEHPFTTEEQEQQEAPPVLSAHQQVTGEHPQVSAIASFSLAQTPNRDQQDQQDPLFGEPVVTWENEGFPYLRPSYQVPLETQLRDTTVLTWDAVGYHLSPESTSSEDDRRTSNSSDDAFYTLDVHRHEEQQFQQQQEEGMLEEISSILKNICRDLELLRAPEHQHQQQQQQLRGTPGSCRNYSRNLTCWEEEEIFSVLEGMFQKLAFLPEAEDVLVNISPRDNTPAPAPEYSRVPESEEAAESGYSKIERSFDIFPQEAEGDQRISLSFVQEDQPEASSASMKISVPKEARSSEFATLHVAVAPKEVKKLEASSEQIASSIVQEVCVSVESSAPLVFENEYTGPPQKPAEEEEHQPREEPVTITEEKLQLTDDILADYTLKVVPRSQEAGASGSSGVVVTPEGNQEEKMISNDSVSSVIHQLCFSVDVPTKKDEAQPELPLQIGIALTGDSNSGSGAEVLSSQGLVARALIRDRPVQEGGEEAAPPEEVAAIILSLEALQKTGEGGCSRSGCSRTQPCGDPNCVLVSEEGVSCIHQDVCILLEVPGPETSTEGIQVDLSIKSAPAAPEDRQSDVGQLISCVEVSDDQELLTEVPSSLAMVEQPPSEDEDEEEEELTPLRPEALEPPEPGVESLERTSSSEVPAPPPSPVEAEAVPEAHDYFREETGVEATVALETHDYFREETGVEATVAPETHDYFRVEDAKVEAEVAPETHDYFREEEPKVEAEAAPETHDYFREEAKKPPAEEWVIDSVFLPKESFQRVEAKVPRPVLRGMTPMDLVRGSLHFDGKACLLGVSTDDLWTAEEMCRAPSSASAAFTKQKSLYKPIDFSAKRDGGAAGCFPEKDMPSWLGEVFGDGAKPVAGGAEKNSFSPVFGFRKPEQKPQQQQLQQQLQQQQAILGFRPPAGITPVFGFRNLSGKQPARPGAHQQVETIFGFAARKPPLPPKRPKIFIDVNVTGDEDCCDSSLSVVSHSRSNLPKDEQPPPARVPDSPGARNIIATAVATSPASCNTTTISSLAAAAEGDQEQDKLGTGAGAIEIGGDEEAGTRVAVDPPKTALDLIDANGGSEEEDWNSELPVLPIDPSLAAAAVAAAAAAQDETFFDALQCSGKHGDGAASNNKLKKYLKDKVWNRFACYGVGMPESDSECASCHQQRA